MNNNVKKAEKANKTKKFKNTNFDKEKYLMDLASTPLISIGLGEVTINPSDYIVEEIKFDS